MMVKACIEDAGINIVLGAYLIELIIRELYMTIELPISIRKHNLEAILKWYSLAYKDKHPSKIDELTYNLIGVLYYDTLEDEKEALND